MFNVLSSSEKDNKWKKYIVENINVKIKIFF